jgi:acyl-CoA reductase-like NAD-dependent aldehyde dehydrogenase
MASLTLYERKFPHKENCDESNHTALHRWKVCEPHGRDVMDSINPTNNTVIGSVTLADEEDARRAIAAAKRAFASFGGTSKEERTTVLRGLHEVVTART